MMDEWSFKYVVEGIFMPAVSVFGLVGNALAMYILHHREVKLKRDFVEVLCFLATYDNLLLISTFFLFTLPTLSRTYAIECFPYTVPYLYPATNTFMTCSVYMTVAVAVNRYLDITDWRLMKRLKSGYVQAAIVLFVSACVNVPRWLEFEYQVVSAETNVTDELGHSVIVNRTFVMAEATRMRKENNYVRDYTLIASTVLIVLLPMAIMLISSFLIYREMIANAPAMSFSNAQERARRRRNRNITLVLIGIIVLFLVCHVGEVAISGYELVDVLDGERSEFPVWASNIVTINHLLVVINSSLNFVIYCKDVVFRRVFVMLYHAWRCGKSSPLSAAEQLRSINKELGLSLQGEPCPEVVIKDHLDAQSQILCGISKV